MRKIVVAGIMTVWVLAFAATAGAITTATVSPTSGPPTSTVTVTGAGFDAGAAIDVYVDTTNVAITTSIRGRLLLARSL